MESIKNASLLSIFSIALVSVILITSQSPAAFAGVVGGDADPDGDNVFSNDNCPFVYNPGQEDVNEWTVIIRKYIIAVGIRIASNNSSKSSSRLRSD